MLPDIVTDLSLLIVFVIFILVFGIFLVVLFFIEVIDLILEIVTALVLVFGVLILWIRAAVFHLLVRLLLLGEAFGIALAAELH